MSKVCLSLSGRTLARNLEILNKYRRWVDIAELRVDYLDPDERFHIRRFPELAGIPTILTVRRKADGGRFVEGEGARIVLLASGLAFADTEKRRNYAYVDLEEDLEVPSLEEAARTFGTRIIRTIHDGRGVPADLPHRLRSLRRSGDEIAKVAVATRSLVDVVALFKAASENPELEKIVVGMGDYGIPTRILSERSGSLMSYANPHQEPDYESTGVGQLDPVELVETYRFKEITKSTRIFGVVGNPASEFWTPSLLNPAFARAKIDAVCVPLRTDALPGFFSLADEIGVDGISVTTPYKEHIVPFLRSRSGETDLIGACNTAVRGPAGWHGYNTDASGFAEALLAFLGKKHLRGKHVSVIGAGGVARAVVSELLRLGARGCVLNRTEVRAKELAERFSFGWGGLDSRGIALLERNNDLIVQATPAGSGDGADEDPIALYRFRGREAVIDLSYSAERTPLLDRAAAAGCPTANGRAMFEAQARRQFQLFTGADFPV